ncbi:helix-turn-helix transcriptional regulator [Pseudobythopirellula maris]|uniref:helix-turn-helix transcriptional regulator n=1 Tax=Pseudobythopirellula maris TaxID=2527991 RepID=UPI0011B82881|nr:LuxR C-terminal-related transcriptional regulator [Pseudobythopirellula maris]
MIDDQLAFIDLVSESFAEEAPPAARLAHLTQQTLKRFLPGTRLLRHVCSELGRSGVEFRPLLRRDIHAPDEPKDPALPFFSPEMVFAIEPVSAELNRRLRAEPEAWIQYHLSRLMAEEGYLDSEVYRKYMIPSGFEDAWVCSRVIEENYVITLVAPRDIGAPQLSDSQKEIIATLSSLGGPIWLEVAKRPLITANLLKAIHGLTEIQTQVLRHALTGLPEKMIAAMTNRSPHTIHNHLRDLYRKFDISSRSELLALRLDGDEADG